MPRPIKCRRVAFLPETNYFKPAGIPMRSLEEVNISVEEAEAIRLKDLEGLEQEKCAERMSISRATFQRVLESARKKLADALLYGKAISIDGGNFELATIRFRCIEGHEWSLPFEAMRAGQPGFCPTCNTTEIEPLQPTGPGGHQRGRGRGQRGRRSR
jgi:predicted DNA-binding protein (UPF0251 family)